MSGRNIWKAIQDAGLQIYRSLPLFKGKLRVGKVLFHRWIDKKTAFAFIAHQQIKYTIPNTIENLGIELLINGIYEQKMVRFLRRQVQDGDVYFDIGANIGALGLPVIKDKTGVQYFGFEASPFVFPYLEDNFYKNGIENYRLSNCLVHENDNKEYDFFESDWYGKSSLAPTYGNTAIKVKSVSLASFCEVNHLSNIQWMKVDVQGFELFVFKGMKDLLLQKKVKNILFEFEYWAEEAAGFEKGAAQKFIRSCGYDLFDTWGNKCNDILTKGSTMFWARPRD